MTNANLPSMLEEAEIKAQKDAAGDVPPQLFAKNLHSREKLEREKVLEENQDIVYLKKQIEKIEEKHTQFELKKKEWDAKELERVSTSQESNPILQKIGLWVAAAFMVAGEIAFLAPTLDAVGMANRIEEHIVATAIVLAFIFFLEVSFTKCRTALKNSAKLGWGAALLFITGVMVVLGVNRALGLEEITKASGILQTHFVFTRAFWVLLTVTMPWAAVLAVEKVSEYETVNKLVVRAFPEADSTEVDLKKLTEKLSQLQKSITIERDALLETVKQCYEAKYFEACGKNR